MPYKIKHRDQDYIPVFVDGGVLDNYPSWLFDNTRYKSSFFFTHHHPIYNQATLGFRLVDKDDKEFFEKGYKNRFRESNGVYKFSASFVKAVANKQDSDHYHNGDRARTIYIDTKEINTVEFGLGNEQKQMLVSSGEEAAKYYLKRLAKREKIMYEYSLNRAYKHAILTGGLGAVAVGGFTGMLGLVAKIVGAKAEGGKSDALKMIARSAFHSGISTMSANFFSSLVTNTTAVGSRRKKKEERRLKRSFSSGLIAGMLTISYCRSNIGGQKEGWGMSLAFGFFNALVALGACHAVDEDLKYLLKPR